MFGQGQFVIQEVEALLQAQVGEFLQAKSKLLKVSQSPVLTVSGKAQDLLAIQKKLEDQLPSILVTIDNIKNDVYSMSDIAQVTAFYAMMTGHLSDVNDLEKEYNASIGLAAAPGAISGTTLILIGVVLGGIYLWKKRKL